MIPDLNALILALFKVANPPRKGDKWRTSRGWFISVLEDNDVKISGRTIYLWCEKGIPHWRQKEAVRVVRTIHNQVVAAKLDELRELKEAMP